MITKLKLYFRDLPEKTKEAIGKCFIKKYFVAPHYDQKIFLPSEWINTLERNKLLTDEINEELTMLLFPKFFGEE